MSVNVVCSDYKSDWIIARLCHHLRKYNKWNVSRAPTISATVNVYFPYVFFRPDKHPKSTKSVVFMTHRENGAKGRMWKRAARDSKVRVCMAERYARELERYQPSIAIPQCYETDMFVPRPARERVKPRVGLAGTVYRGGRKGEELALELYRAKRKDWNIVATSKPMSNSTKWPIPSKTYPWAKMPKYYWGLDVFVCTSTIEGGPVTILEALGCGRPVVIGKDVGIESELPDVSGIQRYERGSLDSLTNAIEAALASPMTPEELQGLVVDRTPKRWARAWAKAVQ